MKPKTKSNLFIGSGLVLAFALAIWSPVQAQSVDPAEAAATTDAEVAKCCRDMKELRLKLKEDCKAQDAQLAAQLAKMNSAPDGEKVGRMAAVVTLIAEQRIALDARRADLEDDMMRRLMQHVQTGEDAASRRPAANDADETPARGAKQRDEGLK